MLFIEYILYPTDEVVNTQHMLTAHDEYKASGLP